MLDSGHMRDPLDVCCMTKTYMSSQVSSTPVLLLPNVRYLGWQRPAPTGSCYARNPMTDKRRQQLQDFAATLEEFTREWSAEHSYFRAAQELRELASGRDAQRSLDGFLEAEAGERTIPIETTVCHLASMRRAACMLNILQHVTYKAACCRICL